MRFLGCHDSSLRCSRVDSISSGRIDLCTTAEIHNDLFDPHEAFAATCKIEAFAHTLRYSFSSLHA